MAADPLAVRAYQSTITNHEKNTRNALAALRRKLTGIGDGVSNPSMALGNAQRMAVDIADLIANLSALKAMHEMSFLAEEER